ncbi:MAG: redoxin family protein [Planctomycetes bacterium]|nr:redoxin family protein [Planctomycetota bacterium]
MRAILPLVLAAAILPAGADPAPGAPGTACPEFRLEGTDGAAHTPAEFADRKAVVLVFTGTQCPACNRYAPELQQLAKDYGARGVAFFGVNPNRNEQAEAAAHAKEKGLPFPVLLDGAHALADGMGIETVPTVVVLDAARKVRYRGRIDDDPMGGRPSRRELREALDAVLDGREVGTPVTEPRGCAVRRREPAADGPVTWSKDVAPIVQRNCVACHRPGQIAPMTLTDFAHASAFAEEIKEAVAARRMPPWKPTAGVEFEGERRLSAQEIETIVKWVDGGTPQGREEDEPELPEFSEGWMLGEPDLVLEPAEAYVVAADGPSDVYMHFVLKTDLPGDTWIQATEIRPGNPRVVHHVIAYVDTSGVSENLDASAPGIGYPGEGTWPGFIPTGEMGGWAPGNLPKALPDGIGRRLAKGASVVLQVHYNTCGSVQKDRTRIGLHFSKKPVKQQLRWAEMVNGWFEIPAGNAAYEAKTWWKTPKDVTVLSVTPHMHLLGKSAKLTASLPGGKDVRLLEIADWEFKWQDSYVLKTPLKLPAGSKITHVAVYDNSEKNPRNPSRPPVPVRWGEKTTDEMCLAYVGYVLDKEDLTKPKKKSK